MNIAETETAKNSLAWIYLSFVFLTLMPRPRTSNSVSATTLRGPTYSIHRSFALTN